MGNLGSRGSQASGINGLGVVVGYSNDSALRIRAFIHDGGTMRDLGTLGGPLSYALGINDAGHVVGLAQVPENGAAHGFFYDGAQMVDLRDRYPHSISNAGQTAGSMIVPGNLERAFLQTGATIQDLGTLGGQQSRGTALSPVGQVVGWSYLADNITRHAFLYADGVMHDLGTLGGSLSVANGINVHGQVVGDSNIGIGGLQHAFIYDEQGMRDLGTLGGSHSRALAINAQGVVVGTALTLEENSAAFVFQSGRMLNLNNLIDPSLGWTLVEATAINDRGQIAGYGVDPLGDAQAFLLTPVPEPTCLAWSTIGIALLMRRRG